MPTSKTKSKTVAATEQEVAAPQSEAVAESPAPTEAPAVVATPQAKSFVEAASVMQGGVKLSLTQIQNATIAKLMEEPHMEYVAPMREGVADAFQYMDIGLNGVNLRFPRGVAITLPVSIVQQATAAEAAKSAVGRNMPTLNT